MNETRAAISLEGAALERGATIKMVCPFCHGGQSGEAKFYLTKDYDTGILLYCCHRASCGRSGRLGGSGVGAVAPAPAVKKFQPWDDSWFTKLVRQDGKTLKHISDYLNKYPWTDQFRELAWDTLTNRLATPYHDPRGYKRGYILRSLSGKTPKTLVARLCEQPVIDWYRPHAYTRTLVLVEDQQSAARLCGSEIESVALLGCTPSDDMLTEVLSQKHPAIAVALDPGAEAAAFKIQKRLSGLVPTSVMLLRKDIKDMSGEEYNSWLESYGYLHH